MIKPDVVLYEEGLDTNTIEESVRAISNAQILIIGGTSLAVYPAAGLIDYFRGEALVVINKSSTSERQKCRSSDQGADRTGLFTDKSKSEIRRMTEHGTYL